MYFFPREIPAVRLGLWFLLGIICSSFFPSISYSLSIIGSLVILFTGLSIDGYKYRFTKGIFITLLVFSLGFTRNSIEETYLPDHHFESLSFTSGDIIGVIQEDPISKNSYRSTLAVEYISGDKENTLSATDKFNSAKGNLLVYIEKEDRSKALKAGDRILLHTTIRPIRPNGNPYSFDFKNYLHHRSINHQCFIKSHDWEYLSAGHLHPVLNLTRDIRQSFLEILQNHISSDAEEAIAAALVLGYRNLLTEDVYDAYTDTGSVHVLAVSGLHLGILTGMLLWLFGLIKTESRVVEIIKMSLVIIAIWMFALITGSAPAVLRAATMFTLFILGKKLFKDINTYNILAASAILLLLVDPFLLFQASFQFSYLALTSILYFQPKLSTWWIPDNRIIRFFWNLAILALAAQILVFPITIYYFHKFPLYFALSGIIAVPFAGIILWISVMLFIMEFIFPLANVVVGYLLNLSLSWFLKMILSIQQLPFCSLDGILINYQQMILIYVGLILMMAWFSLQLKRIIFPILSLAIVFMVSSSFTLIKNINQKEIIVYDVNGGIATDIFYRRNCYTYAEKSIKPSSLEFAASNYRLYHQIKNTIALTDEIYNDATLSNHYGYLSTKYKNILILNQNTPIPHADSLRVDLLIIGDIKEDKLTKAMEWIKADQIVLGRSVPFWKKEAYLDILNNDKIHDIYLKGAYIEKL